MRLRIHVLIDELRNCLLARSSTTKTTLSSIRQNPYVSKVRTKLQSTYLVLCSKGATEYLGSYRVPDGMLTLTF